MKAILYLLPISGKMMLDDCLSRSDIEVLRVFIPESFKNDCQKSIRTLNKNDIPFEIPTNLDSDEIKSWVREDSYDIGLSVGYDKKLPDWLIHEPKFGTINLHPSLLPDYRGANPYFWVIRNGEQKSGSTLHYMDSDFDTGPIIRQESVALTNDETMGTLFFTLNQLGMDMIHDVLDEITETGKAPTGQEQTNSGESKRAPEVNERHLKIDWNQTFDEIDALIRAANPFYGAFTTFRGSKIRIYEVDPVENPNLDEADSLSPSSIRRGDSGPLIRCKDTWARVNLVQVGQKYKASGKVFQEREQTAFEVLDRVI